MGLEHSLCMEEPRVPSLVPPMVSQLGVNPEPCTGNCPGVLGVIRRNQKANRTEPE